MPLYPAIFTNPAPYWALSLAMPEIVGAGGLPGSAAFNANTVLTAVMVEKTQPFNCVGIDIAVSSGNVCCGVYDSTGANHLPNNRLSTSGSVACPGAGPATVSITSIILNPGLYWVTALADNGTATAFFCNNSVFGKNPFISQLRVNATATFPLPATLAGAAFAGSANFYWNLGLV